VWFQIFHQFILILSSSYSADQGRLHGLAVVCWTTDHYHLRLFHLWLRFITFGGHSAHLAYHVHRNGHKTSIIIIIIIIMLLTRKKISLSWVMIKTINSVISVQQSSVCYVSDWDMRSENWNYERLNNWYWNIHK